MEKPKTKLRLKKKNLIENSIISNSFPVSPMRLIKNVT